MLNHTCIAPLLFIYSILFIPLIVLIHQFFTRFPLADISLNVIYRSHISTLGMDYIFLDSRIWNYVNALFIFNFLTGKWMNYGNFFFYIYTAPRKPGIVSKYYPRIRDLYTVNANGKSVKSGKKSGVLFRAYLLGHQSNPMILLKDERIHIDVLYVWEWMVSVRRWYRWVIYEGCVQQKGENIVLRFNCLRIRMPEKFLVSLCRKCFRWQLHFLEGLKSTVGESPRGRARGMQ